MRITPGTLSSVAFFVLLTSCSVSSENNNAEKEITPTISESTVTDSLAYYQQFVLGKWYLQKEKEPVMEIRGSVIDYGLFALNYRFLDPHTLILFNPDNSVDTIDVFKTGDTLIMSNRHEFGGGKYMRYPF